MTTYRILPIPDAVARAVRTSLASPQYGHPAHVETATGHGPCRSCLRTFRKGEERRVLFTYNPFDGIDAYPEPGPVFIHENGCPPHTGPGFPPGLAEVSLTLEAFAGERRLVRREHLAGRDPDAVLRSLLALPEVRYVNLRNTEAGCFVARAEAMPPSA